MNDIARSSNLDAIRRQLKRYLPGLNDIDTLAIYEEKFEVGSGYAAETDSLVPAKQPISLPRMLKKSVYSFIKPLPLQKYGNYNYSHKKDDEDADDSWKPLRRLYYEILPYKQTLLVYHGGTYVEIVASHRDRTGKAVKGSKPFKVLVEQTGRIEEIAKQILKQLGDKAAQKPVFFQE